LEEIVLLELRVVRVIEEQTKRKVMPLANSKFVTTLERLRVSQAEPPA